MSNVTIPVDSLAATVSQILDEYGEECTEVLGNSVKKVVKESVKELKGSSVGGFQDRTGKYRNGWRSKVEETRLSVDGVVYNGGQPGLTHLLEFGHAKQNGGRTRAFPHIAEVNNRAQENFEKELIEKL